MKPKILLSLILILITSLCCQAQKSKSDIQPVGTRYYKWTDTSRPDKEYKANDFREIHVQVWFPIDKTKG